jgi:hypothetical protein
MMNREQRNRISHEFKSCVERTIVRINNDSGHRPFHAALLSEDALFWSKFERSFSTSFGQRVIEKISEIVAISGGATQTQTQRHTNITISTNKLSAIENHISTLRDASGNRGNWNNDLAGINAVIDGPLTSEIRVISDLWWVKNGVNNYMSIKTVKPNIDQTAEAKKDLLKLKISDPTCNVYFGLYYNPYGENRDDYGWTPPMRLFDFTDDQCVLIGQEYWNTLGGVGSYEEVINIAMEVGEITRNSLLNIR